MHDPEYPKATSDLIERLRAGRLTHAEWREQKLEREVIAEIREDHPRYSHATHVAAILRRELALMEDTTTTEGNDR